MPMKWSIRIDGREQPVLEIPHSGPNSVRTVELCLAGLKSAGLVVVVNFTRERKKVDRWLTATTSE